MTGRGTPGEGGRAPNNGPVAWEGGDTGWWLQFRLQVLAVDNRGKRTTEAG
jgi:hypothetical protein